MKIGILGGGPAGLYFAILMKRADPAHDITVYERNRADDTFGFGVVFSDQTLETFERYDRPSFEAITREFAYWQDIEIRHKGTVHRIGGNGFCGCARRTLLMLLQARARSLGVALEFRHEITGLAEVQGADLVVAADGINSAIRQSTTPRISAPWWTCAPTSSPGWGQHQAARRLPVLVPRDRMGRVHRPRLPIRRMGPGARPGCWRPTPPPGSAPGWTG